MSNINLTSVNQGTLWHLNNIKTISGVAGNILTISGNTSLSVMNLGTNIDISGNLNANGNMILPNGTTANRPFGVQGYFRFNTTDSLLEFYTGSLWKNIISTTTSPTLTRTITITTPAGSATTSTWSSGFTSTFTFSATNNSTSTIVVSTPSLATFTLNGAGGAGGANTSEPGGAGGRTTGILQLLPNVTYYLLVGQGGVAVPPNTANSNVPIGGGGLVGTLGYGGQGGGFTGLFLGSITLGSATLTTVTAGSNVNALMIAGGGGGASYENAPGGAGGGFLGGTGGSGANVGGSGGNWNGLGSYLGSGGAGSPGALTGVPLQGGGCSSSGDGGGGGGGGGGYYGGGGGNGSNPGSAGGGGSGFIISAAFSASMTTGGGSAGGSGTGSGTNGSATIAFYA